MPTPELTFSNWGAKHERFRDYFNQCYRSTSIWRLRAKEDYGFTEGHAQWDAKDERALALQGRPALRMNAILPTVKSICGQERGSRITASFKPRGLDDDNYAMIANATFLFAMDQTSAQYEVSHAFQDMVVCGRGFLRVGVNFSDPYEPLGKLSVERLHPLSVFWDPSSKQYDQQDSKYMIIARWVNEDELRLHYPTQMSTVRWAGWMDIDPTLSGERTLNENWRNTRTGQVRLLEVWYKTPRKTYFVITSSGEVQRFASESEARDAVDQVKFMAAQAGAPVPTLAIIDRIVDSVRYAHLTYWNILRDAPSPFTHNYLPIVPLTGYSFDEEVMGEVRNLKDPQREKNKRWSQMLHMINTMAKGGWKIPKNSVGAEQLSKWSTEAGKAGFWFEYNARVGEPKEIAGQNIPTSFVNLMLLTEDEIRKTSLASDPLLGIAAGDRQSGKAIQSLQRGASIGFSVLFDSLVRSHKLLGRQAIELIKQFYHAEKIINILGPRERQQLAMLQEDVLTFISNVMGCHYDVVVDVAPLLGSERERQFQQLVDLLQAGIPVTPGFIKLMVEVSDFPNKDAYLQELTAASQQAAQGGGQGASQGA